MSEKKLNKTLMQSVRDWHWRRYMETGNKQALQSYFKTAYTAEVMKPVIEFTPYNPYKMNYGAFERSIRKVMLIREKSKRLK